MKGRRFSKLMAMTSALLLALTATGVAQDGAVPSGLVNPPAPPQTNLPEAPPPPRTLSPVIWTENPDVVQRFNVDGPRARQMVDNAILKLTSAQDIGTAWTRLGITPKDVVGIKIATMGGPLLSSHRAVVQAICDGLRAAGVPPSQIIIWDKDARDMVEAGYTPVAASDDRVAIDSVFPGTGYDPDAVYKNGLLGTLIWGDSDFVHHDDDLMAAASQAVKNKGYGDTGASATSQPAEDSLNTSAFLPQTSNVSHFARVVSTLCTKIINVPVLIDNPAIGLNGCLGSLALACVDNNRRFQGDPTYGDPAIDEIVSNDLLRRKVVVHIMDALVAQYAGGPRFDPVFTKSIGAIYVSRDPVAIDALVLRRMEQWRSVDKQGRVDPIGTAARHIHSATGYHLGTDDAARIQLLRLP